ncbi:TPA: thymidylate synthase, partial [Vibrio cholerae]|nr:thymidylate synthase [Vibrio cholerae]
MRQYLDLCQRIVDQGVWVENERTGKRCLTVINADLTYDVGNNQFPLVTTRKSFWKAAVAELLGYIRGYDNAADFRQLGTKTWDANANLNQAWLNNPYRKGEDDMGRVYGVQGRAWAKPDGGHIDQLKKIVDDLSRGVDDRGEILNF